MTEFPRSIRVESGIVVDLGRGGKPIGIEITAPTLISQAILNRVLKQFGLPAANPTDLSPLKAARVFYDVDVANQTVKIEAVGKKMFV